MLCYCFKFLLCLSVKGRCLSCSSYFPVSSGRSLPGQVKGVLIHRQRFIRRLLGRWGRRRCHVKYDHWQSYKYRSFCFNCRNKKIVFKTRSALEMKKGTLCQVHRQLFEISAKIAALMIIPCHQFLSWTSTCEMKRTPALKSSSNWQASPAFAG